MFGGVLKSHNFFILTFCMFAKFICEWIFRFSDFHILAFWFCLHFSYHPSWFGILVLVLYLIFFCFPCILKSIFLTRVCYFEAQTEEIEKSQRRTPHFLEPWVFGEAQYHHVCFFRFFTFLHTRCRIFPFLFSLFFWRYFVVTSFTKVSLSASQSVRLSARLCLPPSVSLVTPFWRRHRGSALICRSLSESISPPPLFFPVAFQTWLKPELLFFLLLYISTQQGLNIMYLWMRDLWRFCHIRSAVLLIFIKY